MSSAGTSDGTTALDAARARFRRQGDRGATAAGAATVAVVVLAALVDGDRTVPATGVLLGPLVTGVLAGRRATALVGALATAGTILIAVVDGLTLTGELPARVFVVLAGALAVTGLASVRVKREQELLETRHVHDEDLRALFSASAVPMVLVTPDGTIAEANAATCALLGAAPETLVGSPVGSRVDPEDRDPAAWRSVLEGRSPSWQGELRLQRTDGSWRRVHATASHLRSRPGAPGRLLVQLMDVTDRHNTEQELRRRVRHDDLTGLGNRSALVERLSELASGNGGTAGVLFVDLDHFKAINDTYGHGAGDEVLVRVADRLRHAVRPQDVVCRLAGDEFVVVCAPSVDHDELSSIGRRILDALAQPITTAAGTVPVTASVGGIVVALPTGSGPEELLEQADRALYRAKADGRSTVTIST
jgi:diguanylate cyclase (GGDEF)-like protein/PAS domain S-box-containing protein